jgi:magnesium chelatase family protein
MRNIVNTLLSATLDGVDAKVVEVEATLTKGLPSFSIVGLVSSDIQEAKERTKSALLTNSFTFPPLKVTINLSPSDIKKHGTHFDLPMAILIALHKEYIKFEELFVFGELGLDGRVKSSSALFPIILSLKEQNLLKRAVVPKEAMEYLSYISDVEFIPVESLKDLISILKSGEFRAYSKKFKYRAKHININGKKYLYSKKIDLDFLDVRGQIVAKRASLIASAGMHNLLMEGSPGCGKSMIAKRLSDILPPLSQEEILSIAKHKFLDGEIPTFEPKRPFRSPHHTATSASIFGGGTSKAKIGEVALANNGILFFDELPHFSKNILEALREPLQDGVVNISRVNSKIQYSANIMFVGAMNPCPCGNLLSKSRECRCSKREIQRYKNRLSEPFLDRIDIFVTMQEISREDKADISSTKMREMVLEAFKMQKQRGQENLNGKLKESEINKFCILTKDAEDTLFLALERFGLSNRALDSIKRVARTIADLDKSDLIEKRHIIEAISYRKR